MNVITVIPMSRGIGKETLSYFTASDVALGSLVEVPLRKKCVSALVIERTDARSMKAELRGADFSLRKVEKLVAKPFLPEAFMRTVEEMANWNAATIGATLNVMLPKKVLKSSVVFLETSLAFGVPTRRFPEKAAEVFKTFSERIAYYQLLHDAVFFVPTKERQDVLKKMLPGKVLLPSAMIEIPMDAKLVVIEDAGSHSYKGIGRPFVDFRRAIESYALKIGANVLKGFDSLDNGSLGSMTAIVEEHKKEEDKPFTSIGKTLEKDLRDLKQKPAHIFILGTRRGHSGTVLCQDCGHIFCCERCEAPLTLHTKSVGEDFNAMLCRHCGFKASAMTGCPICKSWRLKAYGLGIEKIEEDVKAFLKKNDIRTYIQRIDSTLKLTPARIRSFIATHFEKESAIIVGTEMLLPYLEHAALVGKRNESSYIGSLDTLLSLPDYSINEKIGRITTELGCITEKKVVIQTRNAEHPLLVAWKNGELGNFLEKEKEERKDFNYPPHGVLIKITIKGKKDKIASEMKAFENAAAKWKPMVFPAFIKAIKNQHILHALIALPKNEWPNPELKSLLLSLPPSVIIEVNPRSLL